MASRHFLRRELQNSTSESERALYKRARDATKESQRQGDAQLKAAVAAAVADPLSHIPVASVRQRCNRFLKFNDTRLEKAYQRVSTTNSYFQDFIPTSLQIAVCIFCIGFEFQAHRNAKSMWGLGSSMHLQFTSNLQYGQLCNLAVHILVLTLQLRFSNWYKMYRGSILWYYTCNLWIWECVKLVLTTDDDLLLIASDVLAQCILLSFIYRLPFCMHLRSRGYGFGCQLLAILARGQIRGAHVLLLSVVIGNLFGLLLAYKLDHNARVAFLKSKRLFDNAPGNNSQDQNYLSYRKSLTRKMWDRLYPEILEKAESNFFSEPNAPHRALGGFAGGFGGVSGLKYARSLHTSSKNLCLQELSDSSDDELEHSN